MIVIPPRIDQGPGRSPCTIHDQSGFRAGSRRRSTEASSAGTCRIASVKKT